VSSTRARVATSVFDRDIGSTSVRGRFHASSTRVRDRGDGRSIERLFVDAFARAHRRSRRRVARQRSIELEGRKASQSGREAVGRASFHDASVVVAAR